MRQIRNFSEAARALRPFIPVPGRQREVYSLERIKQFLAFLGNPQNSLKVVHVAGTSGKTSTAYYAAAQLQAAGFKTGLTVSPHVDCVNERVQIDGQPLAEGQFCEELNEFLALIDDSGVKLTHYEVLVAFAFWEFARAQVDFAVVEVGLGGLLDGTNVVERADKICVITDIGLDHTAVLGNTLAEIAAQKAGIIQPHNHVFAYRQSEKIMNVLAATCQKQTAQLHTVEPPEHIQTAAANLPLFQQRNFFLAEQAVNFALKREGKPVLATEQLLQAASVHIPARMEIIEQDSKTIILDGAHNQQKMRAVLTSVERQFPGQRLAVLVSFVRDDPQRIAGALDELMSVADVLIVTTFKNQQDTLKESIDPRLVADHCTVKGFKRVLIEPDPAKAYELLQTQAQPLLLVGGSFYLLNHLRALMVKA